MYEKELALALTLAEQAGILQLQGTKNRFAVTIKTDNSPVTDIDKACEELITTSLASSFPDDSILGEESGKKEGSSNRCWIIDPLDGTRPFIRGIPTFSTLIALEDNGIPVVGVIHLPALERTCWAAKGLGAFLNGRPIHVSETTTLKSAMGSALGYIEHPDTMVKKQLLGMMSALDYHYGFMDAFSYACLAEGKLDVCVNLLDKPWDCAAAACIVTEAGGTYSDIHGNKTTHNGSIVLSNGILHKETLDFFKSSR